MSTPGIESNAVAEARSINDAVDQQLEKLDEDISTWIEATDRMFDAEALVDTDLGDDPGGAPEAVGRGVRVKAVVQPVLNLLLLHAGFSPFRQLGVETSSPENVAGLQLVISSVPPVLAKRTVDLDPYVLGDASPMIAPDIDAFWQLNEAVGGHLNVELKDGSLTLRSYSLPVRVHPGNEWIIEPGVEAALACMVTPDSSEVTRMFASSIQRNRRPSPTPRSDLRQIYSAVCDLDLEFIPSPPSFVRGASQKVVLPDEVISARRGCCLDTAVLMSALAERAGRRALLVLVSSGVNEPDGPWAHALTGVWRTDDTRSKRPVIRDTDALRSAAEDGLLCLCDSTQHLDDTGAPDHDAAETRAMQMIEHLDFALDIDACRSNEYRQFTPLPERKRR